MICCVTGHRPDGFPFPVGDSERRSAYLRKLHGEVGALLAQGYRHFITGMADGADVDFALVVLTYKQKKEYEGIILEAALPYPQNYRFSSSPTASTKAQILSKCDLVSVISEAYYGGCMQKRNCYMVDHADLVLAVWNGGCKGGTWNTIRYARQKKKPIRYLLLGDFVKKDTVKQDMDEKDLHQMKLF